MSSNKRLLALDAIRGLAVIGMYIQHFASNSTNAFVSGNTMILFVLCSGISYSLMFKKYSHLESQKAFRVKILVRSVFIDLIGYGIILLNAPFGIVLPAYAILYLISIPLLSMDDDMLILWISLSYIACPIIMVIGLSYLSGSVLLADIAGGPLSAVAWLPVFSLGILIGGMELNNPKIQKNLLILGTTILIPAKLFALSVLPKLFKITEKIMMTNYDKQASDFAIWPNNVGQINWTMLFVDAPQGGSSFELLIGTGGCLIFIATLLYLESKLPKLISLFSKVGQVSLTMYVLQFIFAWGVGISGSNVVDWEIGNFFLGDIGIFILVVAIGLGIQKMNLAIFEKNVRKFEKKFI